jgi:hypothetical protein
VNEQEPLFQVIDSATYEAAQRSTSKARKSKYNLDDRTYTTWYSLPHQMGFCTVPNHDEVVQALSADKKEYRQRYPVRMVFEIGDYMVCRDCFMVGADK